MCVCVCACAIIGTKLGEHKHDHNADRWILAKHFWCKKESSQSPHKLENSSTYEGFFHQPFHFNFKPSWSSWCMEGSVSDNYQTSGFPSWIQRLRKGTLLTYYLVCDRKIQCNLVHPWWFQSVGFEKKNCLTPFGGHPSLPIMNIGLKKPKDGIQIAMHCCTVYFHFFPSMPLRNTLKVWSRSRLNPCPD